MPTRQELDQALEWLKEFALRVPLDSEGWGALRVLYEQLRPLTITDERIEVAAKTMQSRWTPKQPWSSTTERIRDSFRGDAKAMLRVVLGEVTDV